MGTLIVAALGLDRLLKGFDRRFRLTLYQQCESKVVPRRGGGANLAEGLDCLVPPAEAREGQTEVVCGSRIPYPRRDGKLK